MIKRCHNVSGVQFILRRKLGISARHFESGMAQERAYYLIRHAGLRQQASVCVAQAVERKTPFSVLNPVIETRFGHGPQKGLSRVAHGRSSGGRKNQFVRAAPLGALPEHGGNLRRHVGRITARLGFHHVNDARGMVYLPEAQGKNISQAQAGMQADHSNIPPQWRYVAKDAQKVPRLLFCQVEKAFVVWFRGLHAVRGAWAGIQAPKRRLFVYAANKPYGVNYRLPGKSLAQKGGLEFRHVKGADGRKGQVAEERKNMTPGKGRDLPRLFERGQVDGFPFVEGFAKVTFRRDMPGFSPRRIFSSRSRRTWAA